MRTFWIGLREEDLLCGSEYGRDTVERMRSGSLVRFGATAIQSIRLQGQVIGFGVVRALFADDTLAVDTDEERPFVERVRKALGSRGIGGRFTLNVEPTDDPVLPTKVVSS